VPPRPNALTLRVAFYSHDALGLGHFRRNLALASRLVGAGSARSALLIGGAREAGALPMPPGVESLTLPALTKSEQGDYRSRSLGVPLHSLLRLRAQTIATVLDAYAPDVLIVDKHPRGFGGELTPGIRRLRERGGVRLVLGLREVLDDPATVRAEWLTSDAAAAVRRDYDRVWVYGDPRVYDTVREYGLGPSVAAKVRYTGYLAPRGAARDPAGEAAKLPPPPLALCLLGGGQDGAALGDAFVRAPLPDGMSALLVTGPYMPAPQRQSLRAAAERRPELHVTRFVPDPRRLLARADRVVTMGGYNTVCEVLGSGRPVLAVPRERPRVEQLLRVERLAERGVVELLREGALSPAAIGDWLAQPARPRPHPAEVVDLRGLDRVPALLEELLAQRLEDREASYVAA
jgi:predicted glycosyltransferase